MLAGCWPQPRGLCDHSRWQLCSQGTLRRLYLDAATPELVRRRVLEGAVRLRRPWQEKATAAAFRSEEEPWRITAVFCMGFLGGFDDEIVKAFASGSAPLRLEAIRAAGQRGVKRFGRPLRSLAVHPGTGTCLLPKGPCRRGRGLSPLCRGPCRRGRGPLPRRKG